MKRVIVVFIILVAGLSVGLYLKLREQAAEAGRPSGGSATIEGTEVDVVARIPERIERILVDEGSAVKQGAVVVELECREARAALAQAEAGVGGAEAGLAAAKLQVDLAKQGVDTAERQHQAALAGAKATKSQQKALKVQRDAARRAAKRLATVVGTGGATEQQLDQAQSQAEGVDQQIGAVQASAQAALAQAGVAAAGRDRAELGVRLAEAQVEATAQQLEAARAGAERARTAVAECTLRAPRDGIVQTRSYEVGEVVTPGTRVLTLVDTREVEATFYLPNAELGAAEPGRKVEVVADAYPDRVFEATIRRVGTSAEFTPRNVQTREDRDRLVYAVDIALENPDGALRPGMPVEVRIPGTAKSEQD